MCKNTIFSLCEPANLPTAARLSIQDQGVEK